MKQARENYNEEKQQYLYWINNEGGFWMVSMKNICHTNELLTLPVKMYSTYFKIIM